MNYVLSLQLFLDVNNNIFVICNVFIIVNNYYTNYVLSL